MTPAEALVALCRALSAALARLERLLHGAARAALGAEAAARLGLGPAGAAVPARAASDDMSAALPVGSVVYLGTDSTQLLVYRVVGPEGAASLERVQSIVNAPNPLGLRNGAPDGVSTEWIMSHPSSPRVYAFTSYWTHAPAVVVTYSADPKTGLLSRLGVAPTGGKQCCHAAFHPAGRWLAASHYCGAAVSVFDTAVRAELGAPAHVVTVEVTRPLPARRGAHTGALAHGVAFSPGGGHLLVCDAGQADVLVYSFDAAGGRPSLLRTLPCPAATVPPPLTAQRALVRMLGTRPRHLAFHPSGRAAYVVHEAANSVTWHAWDEATGSLSEALGEAPTLGPALRGARCAGLAVNAAAEVTVGAGGARVYVSNRGMRVPLLGSAEDSVAIFDVVDAETGALAPAGRTPCKGTPRHFALAPSSSALVVGLQTGAAVAALVPRGGGLEAAALDKVSGAVTCVALREAH